MYIFTPKQLEPNLISVAWSIYSVGVWLTSPDGILAHHRDILVAIQLTYQSLGSFQKELEIYLWVKRQENSVTDQLVTKGWKLVRCNNKKTILEKPVFPVRFLQKVLETSVQWNLDLPRGQMTGKMCLLYRWGFVISKFFFIPFFDWGKKNCSLYRGLRYTIEVSL